MVCLWSQTTAASLALMQMPSFMWHKQGFKIRGFKWTSACMAHSIFCCYASESQFFFSLRHWTKLRLFNVYFFLSDSDAYWMWVCVIMREHKLCLLSVCDFSLSLVGFKYSVLLCSPLQLVRIDNTQTRDLCVLTVRHLYSFVFVPFIVLCIIS